MEYSMEWGFTISFVSIVALEWMKASLVQQ